MLSSPPEQIKPDPPLIKAADPLPGWLPLAILAVTIALLFYRLLAGEVLFWGLPALQFQPWRAFAISELRAGRLPLWNPLNGAGEPLLANYQTSYFYLPMLLSLLLAPGASGLGWLGMLHLGWAGLGMWLYLRQLGLSPFARGLGTLAYALNGAVVARFGTLPMVEAAAWLPWLLFTAERLISAVGLTQQIRRTIWFTLAVTMLALVGHAQWAFYSVLLTGLYIAYRLIVAPIGITPVKRWRWRLIVAFAIGGLLAIGIAAIQLLPTAELQAQSQRASGADQAFALNFSDEWPLWLTQFDPFLFGNPGDGTYTLQGEYFEFASYLGFLPIVIVLIAIGHCARRWRRWRPLKTAQLPIALVPFFTIIAAIGFWLSLGKNTLLFVFLYQHVPTFNQFQAPARWLFWAVIGLSISGAIGGSLWQPSRISQRRARIGLIGAAGVALIGGALLISSTSSGSATLLRGLFTIGLLGSLTAIAFITQPDPARVTATRRWQIGVLIFVALDLLWANALLNPSTSADFYTPQPITTANSARTFQTDAAINHTEFDRILLVNDYRVAGQRRLAYRSAALPELNMIDGAASFNVFEPLRIAWIDRYLALLNRIPTAALFRAAAIATPDNPRPPRVWLVGHLIPTADPFAAIADPGWQPTREAFAAVDAPALDSVADPGDTATITSETPQELIVATHAAHPAALIVADTWYPGWIAAIDDQPTPIVQVNGAFRAVIVPAGDHRITMRYQPESLRTGAVISALSLILLIGLLISTLIKRNRTL